MKKIYVTRNNSKNGKPYFALVVNLGYRQAVLSFDTSLIAEILDISVAELYTLDCIHDNVVRYVTEK